MNYIKGSLVKCGWNFSVFWQTVEYRKKWFFAERIKKKINAYNKLWNIKNTRKIWYTLMICKGKLVTCRVIFSTTASDVQKYNK